MTLSRLEAASVPLELDMGQSNQAEIKALDGGGYDITTTGSDPFVMCRPLAGTYDPDQQYILSFDYFCAEGMGPIELFYGPPIRGGQSAVGPELLSSEGWTTYSLNIRTGQYPGSWHGGYQQFRLDFGNQAGRSIQIRKIELRSPNAHEQKLARELDDGKVSVAAFETELKSMVAADYPARIERVEATDRTIRVTIQAEADGEDFLLCEVPLYQSPVGRQDFVWQKRVPPQRGVQTIEIDRLRGRHDRVFSSWILMRKTPAGLVPASHQRFVDTIPAQWSLTRDRPLSKKGTVGMHGGNKFQYDDYKALGIHNATKNLFFAEFVRTTPQPDTMPHEFNGTTVHILRNYLESLDRAMLEMDQLKIVVSAIILIPKNTPMSHPDCAPAGIYAMPNVVEESGWNSYAAVLDFLAQRYMRPDRKYGRITHWILHNEVDSGWIWTNAGDKPLYTYLDLHYRSMRTAQSVIRRYGDAGDVLISLTHYWTIAHNAKCYKPKEVIDLLAKRSSQEGDFDWGLAYHPYPENLRDPRTWLDKTATFDFQTKRITPKNLEVLDAYMRRKSMLHDGKVRTIVLSEQGSNSPKHDDQSYRDQAAGLVYTWLKFRDLDAIESYVHHQWMDHPQEGGLNLGLRRHSKSTDPEESKKPAWEIWRKLGTPQEDEAFEFAKPIIGIKDIAEVRFRGTIKEDHR